MSKQKEERAILVLYPHLTRADVERVAAELGLVRHSVRPGDGVRQAYEQVWATDDRATAVNYLEDPLVSLSYLSIRGADRDKLASKFARKMETYDPEWALELAAGAVKPETQLEAISRLAVIFPSHDPAAFEVFKAYATAAPNPVLREAAVNAMAYRAWPEFLPLLEQIAREDPSDNVRMRANEILPIVRAAVNT